LTFDAIRSLVTSKTTKYAYVSIPQSHVIDADMSDDSIKEGKHYFRLWLNELYLPNDREWFSSYYPVVHSLVRLTFGGQTIEVPHVAGSLALDGVKSTDTHKAIRLNYPLTTLMPFGGGLVEVIAGLVSVEGKNFSANMIKLLGDFSKLLVVPQLSAALAVAGPLVNGVQMLLGSNGDMQLGLHQTFTSGGGAATLRAGYFAVVGKQLTADEVFAMRVHENRLFSDADARRPFEGSPYMLFQIESRGERDDWEAFHNIQDPFQRAIEELSKGNNAEAKNQLTLSMLAAYFSLDLTRHDRNVVIGALQTRFDESKLHFGEGAPIKLPPTLAQALSSTDTVQASRVGAAVVESFLGRERNLGLFSDVFEAAERFAHLR
jgi:hypothetical protein